MVSLYPNPATSVINMSVNENGTNVNSLGPPPGYSGTTIAAYNITIINSSGVVVATEKSSSPKWQNNVAGLTPGAYVVQIVSGTNSNMVGKAKFIKQ